MHWKEDPISISALVFIQWGKERDCIQVTEGGFEASVFDAFY